ncbi:MAG: hypothetical protein WDN27_00310 [Candidatus Saccharibacteria bacterium]
MDVVYLFKESEEHDSAELRYSLRSLKNVDHDKVFIVGEKPVWATNVEYIPVAQTGTKGKNVARNLSVAVGTEAISEDFIMMNDDFFFMKPQSFTGNLHWGPLRDIIARYGVRYEEDTDYTRNMKQTLELLVSLGFDDPLCYELHVPMILNKTNMRRMRQEVSGPIYQFRSFYGNYFNVGGVQIEDVKIFLDPRHNDPRYEEDPAGYLSAQTLLSATGGSFARGLVGTYVRQRFSEKSPYEI